MMTRLPNLLTLMRIILIPVFVLLFYLNWPGGRIASAIVFAIASITDWLDGYLARRFHGVSPFGTFLDPVADKLMVATALVLLTANGDAPGIITVVIIGREIAVSGLREWMAEIGERKKVAVSWIGKGKAFLQMLSIVLLLYGQPMGAFPTHKVGLWLLIVAAGLTLWSMFGYLRAAWPNMSFMPTQPAEDIRGGKQDRS